MSARLTREAAKQLADKLLVEFQPVCERAEIVGSVRRLEIDSTQIEMVVIPRMYVFGSSLFEDPKAVSEVDVLLKRMAGTGQWGADKRDSAKFKQIQVARFPKYTPFAGDCVELQLIIVTPQTWAVELAKHTGPREFSRSLVTQVSKGGRLPNGHHVTEGLVKNMETGEVVPMVEERDFLEFCGGWVCPEKRR